MMMSLLWCVCLILVLIGCFLRSVCTYACIPVVPPPRVAEAAAGMQSGAMPSSCNAVLLMGIHQATTVSR